MAEGTPGDGLVRALILGLIAGLIILGLLVGAFVIGREDGSDDAGRVQAVTAPATTPAPSTATGTALVKTGRALFASAGCSGCHSLDGSTGAGPTMAALAGAQVTLADGGTVTADDAFLAESISAPDAAIVDGYAAGAMPDLGLTDADVAALVAFIRTRE